MAKKPPPQQLAFSIEGEKAQIFPHLKDLGYGESVIRQLDKNPLFQEKPEGPALVIDLTSGQAFQAIYNSDNWQMIDGKPESLPNPNYARAIVIVNGFFSSQELQQELEELKKKLNQKGSEVFIFENNLQLTEEQFEQIKEERKPIFGKSGFVRFELKLQEEPKEDQWTTGLLTQARLKKEGIVFEAADQYWEMGYTDIDTSEIERCLEHSTLPSEDLRRAQRGYGVEARSPCSCHIKVDLEGSWYVLNHCPDHKRGIPRESVLRTYPRSETLETTCFDCGTNLTRETSLIKRRGLKAVVEEITYCYDCPTTQIVCTKRFEESLLK